HTSPRHELVARCTVVDVARFQAVTCLSRRPRTISNTGDTTAADHERATPQATMRITTARSGTPQQCRLKRTEGQFGLLGDDAELTAAVLAAQDGDETAFRTVYRAVHPRLLGYVRTLVGDPDAEDVTSEAWLQIARDLERFSGDADRFRGWAARIARN